jgi:prepilin-type N-terminal cleavage/methylation domain-containing protein
MKKEHKSNGFTLIEILLTISLFTIATTLLLVNITRPKGIADIQSTENLIYAGIKEAQSQAMAGPTGSYGVHFEQDRFTLFEGSTYSPGDPNNLETTLNTNLTIESISFPGGDLVFTQISGEVQGLLLGQSRSFKLKESNTSETKTFTITSLGAVDVN